LYKIYFVIFGHVYKFLLIFKVENDFYQLNQLKKEFKRPHNAELDFSPRPGEPAWPSSRSGPAGPVAHRYACSSVGHRALGGRGGTGVSGSPVD
jgi:hypothetical protein